MRLIFKFVSSLLLVFSVLFADESGWFPVSPVAPALAPAVLEKGQEWVIFRKTVGQELFLIRFPIEPEYRTIEGRFEVFAEKEGEIFELIVQPLSPEISGQNRHIDGKWVVEEVYHTDHHTYLFRTTSKHQNLAHFSYFWSSFSVEKIDQNGFSS